MKRVLIIGNGFDLSLGLKTSFNDFFQSGAFNDIEESNSLKKMIRTELAKNEHWSDLEGLIPMWTKWLNGPARTMQEGQEKEAAKTVARRDFREIIQAITLFLSNPHMLTLPVHKIAPFLQQWEKQEGLRIYNFNYTNAAIQVFEQYAKDNNEDSRMNSTHHFVHGSLNENNIVIGASEVEPSSDFLFALKSSSPGSQPPSDFLDNLMSCDELDIFGHSLGDSDHPYFARFFERLIIDTEFKPKTRVITRDSESEARIRERINAITKNQLTQIMISSRRLDFIHTKVPLNELSQRILESYT